MNRSPKKKAVISPPYQSSEELYQALFEQAADGIFIANVQGRFVEVNRRGCEMLGYTREEMLDLSIEDLIPAEDLAIDPLQLDALRAGKTLLKERRLRCKDGSLLPVEINARMLSDGSFLGMVRDISKRQQAVEQLKNLEARWRSLLQSIPAFVVEIDLAGIIQSLNQTQPGFEVEDFVGRAAVEVTARAGREAFQAAFSTVIETGQIVQYEASDYGPHGVLAWYSHQLAPILKDDQIVGVIMVVTDITERKQAEQELQKSERYYRMLTESLTDFVLHLDSAGRIQYINRLAEGYTKDMVLGKHVLEFLALESREVTRQALKTVLETGRGVTFENVGQRTPAMQGWYFTRLVPISDDSDVDSVLLIATDITERKQAEAALRQSEAKWRTLAETVPDVIMTIDRDGRLLFINRSVTGVDLDQVIGKNFYDFMMDEYRDTAKEHIESVFQTGEPTSYEVQGPKGLNPPRWFITRVGAVQRDEAVIAATIIATDITERKRAEEALEASEARFRTFVDHAADAFFLHDERGTILDVNRQACESLGYSRQELVGMTPHHFDAGFDHSFINQINTRLDAGEVIEFDTQHRRKDGSVFPVELRIRPFWHGERRFGVSLAHDITERKRAEEALRESEERLRQIASSLREVVWLRDVQTRQVLYVNPAFQELTGRTCESFYENRDIVIDAIHPDDKERVIKGLDQRFESIPFDKEHRIIHLDGSVHWVSSRSFPVRNKTGEVYRWASIMEDITERKQAEEALRASEERYRVLYHENPSMFFTLDAEGAIISVNEFGASQLGYTKDELEGQPVLKVCYAEDEAAVSDHLKICLQNPGQVYYWQFRKVRKDGSLMWVEEFARAINGPDGVVNVLVVCQDITKRKRLEAENEQLAAQFYQAQKMESIGRLAGGIAHDFNNLLVPIIGYIDLNLTDLSPESGLYADLTQVRKAADRAADLTRQILAFSRQQVLELRLLGLNTIIEEFKKMLQRLIGEDIELQTFLSPFLFPVKADRGQIEQVLMNLAINARDAMPVGGKLTIETANTFFDEAYLEKYASDLIPGHYVMLAVSDTGQGMDAETRKRIFDPFFTTKESDKGTGLGLATIFGIIKQHQGHIWVYSEPGQGTTFKIYLPKAKDTIRTTVPIPQEPISIYGTETVMVVEDDEMVRKLVCETLEAHGYDVIEAQSPVDCLKLASGKDTIHLLLTDVIMPEMNGKELYRKLMAIHPNSRVLYMSGYTNNVVVHHSILDEGINFLQKPFTVQNLAQKVRGVLG